MLVISIDGACRRNGKLDCVSAGGVFIQEFEHNVQEPIRTKTLSAFEMCSTNQRGEMQALREALLYMYKVNQSGHIITDSEYLFNAMTKDWLQSWSRKGWVTATGEPVKNKDLWEQIYQAYLCCDKNGLEVMFYHIKGHCIPFGKVTASSLLAKDESGKLLMQEVISKLSKKPHTTTVLSNIEKAKKLSLKNNGFEPTDDILESFIVANTVVDAVATQCVEAADALYLNSK